MFDFPTKVRLKSEIRNLISGFIFQNSGRAIRRLQTESLSLIDILLEHDSVLVYFIYLCTVKIKEERYGSKNRAVPFYG